MHGVIGWIILVPEARLILPVLPLNGHFGTARGHLALLVSTATGELMVMSAGWHSPQHQRQYLWMPINLTIRR